MISSEYNEKHLSSNHKEIVMETVTSGFLNHFKEDLTVCTAYSCSITADLGRVIPTLVYIFHNNYRKKRNKMILSQLNKQTLPIKKWANLNS